jgi:isopenicillin-N epimerase
MTSDLKSLFLLNPEVAYLNHGSFGACPRPIFEAYQRWQLELEREPVDFLVRQVRGLFKQDRGGPLDDARSALANYVNAPVENLAFTLNATTALNTVARSIQLAPGDEVLTTDHEYGSIEATWERACGKAGAKIVRHQISLPVTTHADFVEAFWASVTPSTRVILMSHITSAAALILPIAEICRRAREAGIITVIDGAHAVGQIPLDLAAIDPDYYTSNCHKWLCTPKGVAFMYVHPDRQEALEPLVISWAWVNQQPFSLVQEMWGTMDLSGYLCIPAALDFFKQHNWDEVRKDCRARIVEARRRLVDLIGLPPIAPEGEGWLAQMAAVTLPDAIDARALWDRLFHDYKIEVLAQERNGMNLLRISLQGYNTQDDLDRLYVALKELL